MADRTYIANATRKENDSGTFWSLAMRCMLFSDIANEKIDVGHTMEMVLVHDLVEIDAGDTYAMIRTEPDKEGKGTLQQQTAFSISFRMNRQSIYRVCGMSLKPGNSGSKVRQYTGQGTATAVKPYDGRNLMERT